MSNLMDNEFYQLKDFIYTISSIDLAENKRYLVEQRLKPLLKKYKLIDYRELLVKLSNPENALVEDIISAMTTNETSFFRDSHIFSALETEIFPKIYSLAKKNKVKIWSAACSTGQEPYTIAMILDSYADKNMFHKDLDKIEIKASDLDTVVLNHAKRGIYNNFEISRGMSQEYKNRYMIQLESGKWEITDTIKKRVSFSKINLVQTVFYPTNVDLIFCRNVLIYFDQDTKKNMINGFYKSLKKGGYLILGSSETLYGLNENFMRVDAGRAVVYIKE